MKRRFPSLVLLGAPGAGKGTYSKLLAPKFGFKPVSTGELIRQQRSTGTTLGAKLGAFADAGKLVPDSYVNEVVQAELSRYTGEGLILDGYPRTVEQADFLDQQSTTNAFAVNIVLKEEYIVRKILGRRYCATCHNSYNTEYVKNEAEGVDLPALVPKHGDITKCDCGATLQQRADDSEEILFQRLEEYNQKTLPLVEYYTAKNKMYDFIVKRGVNDMPILEDIVRVALKEQASV